MRSFALLRHSDAQNFAPFVVKYANRWSNRWSTKARGAEFCVCTLAKADQGGFGVSVLNFYLNVNALKLCTTSNR